MLQFSTIRMQFKPANPQFSHRNWQVARSLIDVDIRLKDTLALEVFNLIHT
ncbi:hypothetical protein BN2497_11501 [Janthinobacterium sp. CG23_2]|nr:hypothetical protein BN2497_11501 [Janthinobacterium sp. CG23_2]CUU32148.1 hypothetical protein BN3177_11501 [Janthinobacterium sp. CG23_2]